MNWNQIEGRWHEVEGDARATWRELSDEDLRRVAGERERLVDLLSRGYAIDRMSAERRVDDWLEGLSFTKVFDAARRSVPQAP